MKLWVKILIALVLGVITGIALGPDAAVFKPIGTIFLSLINMIIVLLVLSTMTIGVTSIHDPKKLSKIGTKSIIYYLTTTIVAILLGLVFSKFFSLGSGLDFTFTGTIKDQATPSLGEILLSVIPTNPVASLATGNILQIIVFSLFLGFAINFSGEKGKPLLHVLESLADVMYRLTSIIMEFSPIGVFAIMAWVAGTFGVTVLLPLLKFLGIYYLACFVHLIFVYCGMLTLIAKLNPWPFFRGMSDAIMIAFSTSSSTATLPVSMHCVQKNLGVSKNVTNFMLPLGCTINMNGAALFQGMASVFVANAYGIVLDLPSLITIVVTGTLSAVGAAGIPGTGLIMLSVVFASVGLPIEGLALIAGIDRIREMGSTVLNVLGDAVCAVCISKQEGEFDEKQYYHRELVEVEID